MSAALKHSRPPGRTPRSEKEAEVRIGLKIPVLMRQALREREKLSGSACADVVRSILMTSLRAEMELIRKARGEGIFKKV